MRKNSQCLKTTQCLQAKTYLCDTLIGVKLHDDFCCLKIYIYLFFFVKVFTENYLHSDFLSLMMPEEA